MHFAFGQAFAGAIAHHHIIDTAGEALSVDRDQCIRAADREGPVIDQRPYPVVDSDRALARRPATIVIRYRKATVIGRRENEQLTTSQRHNVHDTRISDAFQSAGPRLPYTGLVIADLRDAHGQIIATDRDRRAIQGPYITVAASRRSQRIGRSRQYRLLTRQ